MDGQADHVWSLIAGSLYMTGVKKGVKRAEQMEEERERQRQNGQMGKCWEGKNCSVQRGVKTLLCKGRKKISTSEKIEGRGCEIPQLTRGYKTEMQRHGWQWMLQSECATCQT